jgi:polyisoprenoid-binding protein YceI
MKKLAKILALLILGTGSLAQAETWEIDPSHSAAQFSIRHLMISNVRGEFSKVTGTLEWDGKNLGAAKLQSSIDVSTVNTREPKRDEHLKSADFLDVAKFPAITFTGKSFAKGGHGKLKVVGDLTLHGVTKSVTLDVEGPSAEAKDPWGNTRIGASATTKINRKDFGLTWNKALETGGFVVGDELTITLDIELIRKAAPAAAK